MNRNCPARQHSDQMVCDRRGLVWEVNDPEPPECLEEPKPVGAKVEPSAITDYWYKYYFDHHCTLCGNSGRIDTRGVRTAAGIPVGRVNYCICPNGQALRPAK
jgi:hypothetical protein